MTRTNPQIKEAFKTASLDMKPELKKIREERPNELWFNWETYENGCDVWNVSMSDLYNPETTRMNRELGLSSVEGINQWYK
jgi:uncharacterized protein (DUF2249 family)